MSGSRGGWNYSRRSSIGYQLQFTDVPRPSSHVRTCGDSGRLSTADDDVWDEELPQDALHEALVLESQAVMAHPAPHHAAAQQTASTSLWETSDDDLLLLAESVEGSTQQQTCQPRDPAKPGGDTSSSVADPSKLDLDQQYKLQGEMSLLRAELQRRQSEIELLRRQSSEQTQQLQQQHEQQLLSLRRSLDALHADLKFKDHELSQANIKFKLNSPDPSPRRKVPKLSSSPGSSRAGFITREEFSSGVAPAAVSGEGGTLQRSWSSEDFSRGHDRSWYVQVASAVVELVLRQSAAGTGAQSGEGPVAQSAAGSQGAALWITSDVTSALSRLMASVGRGNSSPGPLVLSLTAAMAVVCATLSSAVCAPFKEYLSAVQSIQTAHQRNRRGVLTITSSRHVSAVEQEFVRTGDVCLSALQCLSTVLSHCFTVGAPRVPLSPALAPLLCHMLRPCVVQNEVRNPIVMEYVFNLCAEIVDTQCTTEFVDDVLSVLPETINTRPSSGRLLSSLLQLLIALASAGGCPLSRLWCSEQTSGRTSATSTCILKKLSILFNDGDFSNEDCTRYTLPSLHSRAATPLSQAGSRPDGDISQVSDMCGGVAEPAVRADVSFQFCRLVSLVLSSESCRPRQSCCWTFLTVLAVRVMSFFVLQWRYHHDGQLAADCLRQLIASIHLLSSLNANFPSTVSKVRVHYLIAMETVSRHWQNFRLTQHSVELLSELYRFKNGV